MQRWKGQLVRSVETVKRISCGSSDYHDLWILVCTLATSGTGGIPLGASVLGGIMWALACNVACRQEHLGFQGQLGFEASVTL